LALSQRLNAIRQPLIEVRDLVSCLADVGARQVLAISRTRRASARYSSAVLIDMAYALPFP
jgi:hypothetical protein